MKELTTRERMLRTFRHQDVDRIVLTDIPWAGTIQRWQNEGMPRGIEWEDYFGFEKIVRIQPDNSPRYPKFRFAGQYADDCYPCQGAGKVSLRKLYI